MTGRHRAGSGPQGRAARHVETSDFVAMMHRFMIAWGDRVGDDPAALVHLRELMAALEQQTNRGVFLANRQGHYSQREIAAVLGLTRQAIAHRIKLGELAHAALVQLRGGGAVIRLGDIRARRADLLEAAGLPDRTGSERERKIVQGHVIGTHRRAAGQ